MDSTLNTLNEEQGPSYANLTEKSELMQFFERHVHDLEWAHRDLLKEIFFGDTKFQA